jgi:hypothetical protein
MVKKGRWERGRNLALYAGKESLCVHEGETGKRRRSRTEQTIWPKSYAGESGIERTERAKAPLSAA